MCLHYINYVHILHDLQYDYEIDGISVLNVLQYDYEIDGISVLNVLHFFVKLCLYLLSLSS